ncbi:MAG TPA: glycosyltransferase family 4 protein [Steroidobacteraceae bacterium]|nr:glycosyltransferase family 4 protein [Steroidobacteraceae bacterium]
MSAEPTTVMRPMPAPVPVPMSSTGPRHSTREARVRVLQLGPALDVRGGVSAVEQLICDYLPPYAAIRHVATTSEAGWMRRGLEFGRALHQLSRALDSIEPTVIHVHFASRGSTLRKMLLAQLVIRARRPLILHAHGGGFDRFHRGLPSVLRRLVNRTLQQANLVITLSSQWRDFYIRECELAPSQVVVLPNPVRVPAKIPDRSGHREVQFVHLGKLGKGKGSYDLVKAFLALPDELRARARLVLAGNGDVAELQEAAGQDSRITVLPWVDSTERDRLLAESDVFVLPSYAEGVPMSLLESMAAGMPCITTPVGGIPDLITQGVEGLLVPPGDVEQLSLAMARLITDDGLRVAAGLRAYERAGANDVHAYARRLAEHYLRIAPVAELRVES